MTDNKKIWPLAPKFEGDGLSGLSALEQARRIAEGDVSSLELLEHYLERIKRHDRELGAFVEVYGDRARAQAERADAVRQKNGPMGIFHGVPTAVKDHHMVRFTRTRLGSKAFNWLWSPVDDGVVKRLRRAGFLIIGKTTMSELGLLPITEPPDGRPTRNPWDLGRSAGGSSGGAGAALGAGLLPVAPGSDGAGSVRIPSAINGLVGLKPTRGLVKDGSEKIDPYGLTSVGPMARSIDDAAALLDVLAGAGGSYLKYSRRPCRKLRVGVIAEPPFGELHSSIQASVERAAKRLEDAGHEVQWRKPPEATLEEFTPLYQRFISRIPIIQPSKLEEVTRWFRDQGQKVPAKEAWQIYRRFEALGNDSMAGVDVMVTPTVGILAPNIGEFSHLPPAEYFRATAPLGMFTALANITGQPALTVPFGQCQKMPVGIQLLGRSGDDALLFRLARIFEECG